MAEVSSKYIVSSKHGLLDLMIKLWACAHQDGRNNFSIGIGFLGVLEFHKLDLDINRNTDVEMAAGACGLEKFMRRSLDRL